MDCERGVVVANKAAAIKHLRQSQKRRMRNKPVRTFARGSVRAALDAIDDAIDTQEWSNADTAIQDAVKALDRAAQRGVIHANTAARRKSRLLRQYHTSRNPDVAQRPRTRPPEPARTP